jgi:hypothetical protein
MERMVTLFIIGDDFSKYFERSDDPDAKTEGSPGI